MADQHNDAAANPDRVSPDAPRPAQGLPRDPRREIPEILRTPVDHPSLHRKPAGTSGVAAFGDVSKALAIGLDFLFVGIAAAVLGWLADRWLGSSPIGLLIGLCAGFAAGTYRLIARLQAEERAEVRAEAQARRNAAAPRGSAPPTDSD